MSLNIGIVLEQGANTNMVATAKSSAKSVSIIPRGRGFQDLFKGMDEGTDRIAQAGV